MLPERRIRVKKGPVEYSSMPEPRRKATRRDRYEEIKNENCDAYNLVHECIYNLDQFEIYKQSLDHEKLTDEREYLENTHEELKREYMKSKRYLRETEVTLNFKIDEYISDYEKITKQHF